MKKRDLKEEIRQLEDENARLFNLLSLVAEIANRRDMEDEEIEEDERK